MKRDSDHNPYERGWRMGQGWGQEKDKSGWKIYLEVELTGHNDSYVSIKCYCLG